MSKNTFAFKLIGTIFVVITILVVLSGTNQIVTLTTASTQVWTNCTPVSGNINQPLTNVDVSTTDNTYLPAFIQELVGISLGQTKSFVIPANEGYQSGQLAGQNLYFNVTITKIYSGATIVSEGDIVDLVYSLWIDCSTQSSGTTTQSNIGSNTVPTANNIPLYVGGGVVLVGIIATIGYTVIRKSNTSSSETIQKSQTIKEQKNLNQIKNLLEQKKENPSNQDTVKTDDKHMPNSRPRRR